jgi:hypothetical protein
MKLNFNELEIYTPEGEVMQQQNKSGQLEKVNIKDILILALRGTLESDKNKNLKELQNEDFKILCKFIGNHQIEIDLSSEDVSRIKEKLAPITDPWTYGQISMILEGDFSKLKEMFQS